MDRLYKKQSFKDNSFIVVNGSLHPDYSYFTFEVEEKEFREKYWNIKSDDVVFDIGASYGSYTLPACSLGATVFSFEPEKLVFDDLVENINVNKFNNICSSYNFGLYSSQTEIDFSKTAPHWPKFAISSLYKMDTIDRIVKESKIERLDWIKIDVEGAEEHTLFGGRNTILQFAPNFIIECHTFMDPDIVRSIKRMLSSFYNYKFEEISRSECVMLVANR